MSNKPFISQNTNIFNENKYNSVPGNVGTDAVLITQSSHRRVIDQKLLTITKNDCQPSLHYNYISSNATPSPPQKNNVLPAQKEYFPGGVSYTFNQLGQNCTCQGYESINNQHTISNGMNMTPQYFQQQSLTLEQQIALKQLEKEGLQLTLMKERLKQNPYQLIFHQDCETSTSDLLNSINQISISQGLPDFKNACSEHSDLKHSVENASKQIVQCDDPCCLYSSKKKLVLTKSPDLKKQAESLAPCDFHKTKNNNDDDDKSLDDDVRYQEIDDFDSEDSNSSCDKTKDKKKKRICKKVNNPQKLKDKDKQRKNARTRKRTDSEESINRYKKRKRCKIDETKQKRKQRKS